ncbi:hypothetical protein SRABI106_02860 [Rahnella aquatilis]|nr:hypothetical protein SRABI106_02860 [Rahnella aquatilis]
MTFHHVRVLSHQEFATHREATVVVRFRNTGFLQQRQGRTARTDKHEFRFDNAFFAVVFQVGNGHVPGVIRVTFNVAHFMTEAQGEVRLLLQRGHQLTGDFAEVYVGTNRNAGRSDFLRRITPFHHQRDPLFDLRRVF